MTQDETRAPQNDYSLFRGFFVACLITAGTLSIVAAYSLMFWGILRLIRAVL